MVSTFDPLRQRERKKQVQERGFRHLLRLMLVPRKQEPKEWFSPDRQEDYRQQLYNEGFIVPQMWDDQDLTRFPVIMADLEVLEKYLMPAFWNFNQKARHYQSRYYYYQRIFIIGAFLTTVVSVVNSFIHASSPEVSFGLLTITASAINVFLGICTAIISARATYYTLLANYGEPRQRWARYRRLTEELRMLYFKFLGRLEPFNTEDRVTRLRERILEIRQQEQEDG
jgi:hypothetical protein